MIILDTEELNMNKAYGFNIPNSSIVMVEDGCRFRTSLNEHFLYDCFGEYYTPFKLGGGKD